jgi:hypothetical protein
MNRFEDTQREIDSNYQAFITIRSDLMARYPEKFVVMRHCEPVEFFDTARDALVYASRQFSDGLFSVQEVAQKPVDLGWFSHAAVSDSV